MPTAENADNNDEDVILKDLNGAAARAGKATYLEAKNEFAENCYPLMIAMYEELNERLTETEGALAEIIDQQGSYLQPDIASQILATVEVGRALVGEIRAMLAAPNVTVPDDWRKRMDDACNLFGVHAEATAAGVQEIVADTGEPEDDEDADEDDAEDDEEDVVDTDEEEES